MQDPDTGAFHGTTCQDAYPGYGRTTPNNVPPYQPGEVGTIDTARAVGALAYAAHVFQSVDPAFAKQCLDAALAGYAWLEERPDEHTDSTLCPAYAAGGDEEVGRHVRMYAAAALLLATNETGYADDFEAQYVEPYWISDYNRTNVYAAHLYLRAPAGRVERKEILRERLRTLADGTIDDGAANPFGWATHYYWGSLSNGFHRVSANVRMVLDGAGQPADEDEALANVHHLLGRSYYHFCFVGGLEGVEDGLQRGFHHWLQALDAKPRDYPGIVPGGPNEEPHEEDLSYPLSQPFPTWGYWDDPARPRTVETPLEGRYTDNDSWSTNEPAVNYQAATLYHLYFAAWIAANEPTDPGGEDAGEDVGTPEPVPDDGPPPDPGGGIPDAGPLPDAVAWADVRADEGPAPDAATGHDADRPDLAPPRDLAPAADLATAGTGDEPPGLHLDGGCSAGGAGGAGSGPAAWILPFLLAWLAARRPLRSRRVHG
jgi:endoglucanase